MSQGRLPHRPRKRFGQHFLHDNNVIMRIISAVNTSNKNPVLEIGPGRGALTFPLLRQVDHLDVIEIDSVLAEKLQDQCPVPGKLTIHNIDALKFDFCALIKDRKLSIIGNLPYNITTPLLFHLLDQIDCIDEMLFMLQKEVADRICAHPDTREYGRLSVMIQSYCLVDPLFTVAPEAFTPAPRVESKLIRLTPLIAEKMPVKDRSLFEQIVRMAFSHRRKTLRNALKGLVSEALLEESGISPDLRPQALTVLDYAKIANTILQKNRKPT